MRGLSYGPSTHPFYGSNLCPLGLSLSDGYLRVMKIPTQWLAMYQPWPKASDLWSL